MPSYICPHCGTKITYIKGAKQPRCKCNVPFFRAEKLVAEQKDVEQNKTKRQPRSKLTEKKRHFKLGDFVGK